MSTEIVEVYGSKIKIPLYAEGDDILYKDNPRQMQRWVREELPEYFSKVEYNKNGDLILTKQQEEYAKKEVERCKKGVFALIGGKIRWIPPRYYFFLQYYILEDGTYPEFREADRQYYIFHYYWFGIEWCLGNIRTKRRRRGASSQSCSNILHESVFFRNSNCGLISKTKDDSKDTFTQMITYPYRQFPAFIKPKQVNKEDSVTELVFAHKSQNYKEGIVAAIKSEEGHNSKINYKAPVLNAYDRGRMSYVLGDEFGKLPQEVPASRLLAIISKTLVRGVKRVGWIDLPSTVNEMTKGGGAEYKKIWDAANQFDRKITTNRLVRFYQPAYEAYEGFIDMFGDSVLHTPTDEQYEYLVKNWVKYNDEGVQISELSEEDIKLGAIHYVQVKRREGLEGIDLEEEIRMNPCTEDEAFESASVGCLFNSFKLSTRKSLLKVHEKDLVERGNFMWDNGERDTKVIWVKDDNGRWLIVKEFLNNFVKDYNVFENGVAKTINYSNATEKRGGLFIPKNDWRFGSGVDPYDHDTVEDSRRSRAASIVKQKLNQDNFDDKFNWCDVCRYVARPATAELMYEDILIQSFFFSCRILAETQKPGIITYFRNRGYGAFLMILPGYREPGIPSTPQNKQVGAEYTEFDVETRIDKYYFIDVIEDLLQMDIKETQKYDLGMAKLWTEVACMNKLYERRQAQTMDISDFFRKYKTA